MNAATLRLRGVASNIANMRNEIPLSDASVSQTTPAPAPGARPPGVFYPVRTDQTALASGGVQAKFTEVTPAHVPVYSPSSPVADADGMVARPNVALEHELVNMMQGEHAYRANAKTFAAQDDMIGALLDAVS